MATSKTTNEANTYLPRNKFQKLFEHLAGEFDDSGYALYVARLIDIECRNYASGLKPSRRPTDWGPIVDALNTLILSYNTTPHRIAPRCFVRRPNMMQMIYWLEDVKEMRDLQTELNPKKPRGAPPNERRSELIRQLWRNYPKGTAKKTEGSHFEKTVQMVLSWLEPSPKDLHKTIIKALKGCN
jgi:hypothetical protein